MQPSILGRAALLSALSLAAPATAGAQSQVYTLGSGRPPFFSCSAGGCQAPAVHLINAVTGHELSSIVIGGLSDKGTSLRLSSDGTLLFVTTVPHAALAGEGRLWMVDARARRVLAQVAVGAAPSDVVVLPDNSRAYVVNNAGSSVSVVDLPTFTVAATVAVGGSPSRAAVTPTGSAVYVTNTAANTVSKISTATNSVEATLFVGASPGGIDISPDGSRVFVANAGSQTISVINASLDSVLLSLAAGSSSAPPIDVSAPSSTRAFVTLSDASGSGSAVQLLNATDGAVIGSTSILPGGRLARDSSGTPTYVVETAGAITSSLKQVAADATSATAIAARHWTHAVVLTDPCAFEATAEPARFGAFGGSGTLTIPAPAGCPWSIDTTLAPGFSFAGALTGTGSATRAFSVEAADAPKLATVVIGRQTLTLEQTIPRMVIESPTSGAGVLQEPFFLSGWTIDQNLGTSTSTLGSRGIDFIHVWAFPATDLPITGPGPIFVASANAVLFRPDVAALFGSNAVFSGFRVPISALPSGRYTLAVYAHSAISNSFVIGRAVDVTVQQARPRIVVDTPSAGTVRTPFVVAGWAIDPSASGSGSGIDVVHVWAYPPAGSPVFLGQAAYGGNRSDVGSFLGSRFNLSGFSLTASLPPGAHTLVVFARSTATGQFTSQTVAITVAPSDPRMVVDAPTASTLSSPFDVVGWALDFASGSGSGVDAVHVWAYPVTGAQPVFLGAAAPIPRPDVAFYGGQFINAGFRLNGATLPPGTYDLVVFARSTIAQTFNNARVVRITIQ